jgi:shikimate kinase
VGEHLLLVGMMGTGKSTTGRILAARLGRPHVDTDEEVERRTGVSVREVFAAQGEPAFRRHEAAVLASVLASDVPSVVSVGGGAVLDPVNRDAMRAAGTVVWLRARPDTLAQRVGDAQDRPLLGAVSGDARRRELVRIDASRRALYDDVAMVTVDVDRLDPAAAADWVIASVGRAECDQREVHP